MKQRGFSLAELLISLLILSTLTVVMVGVIPTTIFGLHQAGERASAAMLARQTLEQLRQQGPTKVYNVVYPPQMLNNLKYLVNVTYAPAVGCDGYSLDPTVATDVTITVRWSSRGGNKVLSMRDLVSRP